jgi:hypothetical protein
MPTVRSTTRRRSLASDLLHVLGERIQIDIIHAGAGVPRVDTAFHPALGSVLNSGGWTLVSDYERGPVHINRDFVIGIP